MSLALWQRVKDLELFATGKKKQEEAIAFIQEAIINGKPGEIIPLPDSDLQAEVTALKERLLKLEMQYRALNARLSKKLDPRP